MVENFTPKVVLWDGRGEPSTSHVLKKGTLIRPKEFIFKSNIFHLQSKCGELIEEPKAKAENVRAKRPNPKIKTHKKVQTRATK